MAESKTKALAKNLLKAADEVKAAASVYGKALEDAVYSVGAYHKAIHLRESGVDFDALKGAAQKDKDDEKKAHAVYEAKTAALDAATAALQKRLIEKKKVKNPFKKLNVAKAQAALDHAAKSKAKMAAVRFAANDTVEDLQKNLEQVRWHLNDIIEFRKSTNEVFAGLDDDE